MVVYNKSWKLLSFAYIKEIKMGKEGKGKDEFYLDIKDSKIATLNRKTGEITGLEEGETTVWKLSTWIK